MFARFLIFYRVFEVREIARDFSRDCSFGKNVNKVAIFELSSAAFSTTRFDDRNDGMIPSCNFIITKSTSDGGSLPP